MSNDNSTRKVYIHFVDDNGGFRITDSPEPLVAGTPEPREVR